MRLLPAGMVRAVVLCAVLAAPAPAWSQTSQTTVEAGAFAIAGSFTFGSPAPGVGGWVDVNVAPRLALEARADTVHFRFGIEGAEVTAGIRALFVRSRAFGFYGFIGPGAYHETRSVLGPPNTHYVLDFGAGGTFVPAPRLLLRVELEREIHAEPGLETPQVIEEIPIASTWNLTGGASYRFGGTLPRPGRAPSGRWTFGPQLGYTVATSETVIGSAGGFVAYRVLPYCDIDASAMTWLGRMASSSFEGGHLQQALVGAKVGVRQGRVGVFFKIRSGVNSYSHVERCCPLMAKRSTVPALDLGGVIEVATSRRLVVRFDIGETLSFVPAVDFSGEPPHHVELYTLPAQVGLGWRF